MKTLRTKTRKKIVQVVREVEFARETLLGAIMVPVLLLVIFSIVYVLWFGPIWEVSTRVKTEHLVLLAKDRLDLENTARTTLVQFFGGVIVLIGSYVAYRNVKAVERNIKVSQEGQITERFTQAIEQFGSDKTEIRLGGIYALERIALDSERDHGPIMEVLSNYVRSHCPIAIRDTQATETPIPTEVQAIMTVIGRRECLHEIGGHAPTFGGIDLRGLNLEKASLEDISFDGADMDSVNMSEASLEGASFVNASLQFARLKGVELRKVNLMGARLARADLSGCDLRQALNLTAFQVSSANFDKETLMTKPMHEELVAIWKQKNKGLPEAMVDDAQAAVLGIQRDKVPSEVQSGGVPPLTLQAQTDEESPAEE